MKHKKNISYFSGLLSLVLLGSLSFTATGKSVDSKTLDCPLLKRKPEGECWPCDYRDPTHRGRDLSIVEQYHFTINIATLQYGNNGTIGGDIGYTLNMFPNHHRALRSLANLAIREKKSKLQGMDFTVPCYFIRATNFTPNDGMVNAIYAYYLGSIGQKDMAVAEINQAIQKDSNNSQIAYEIGLAYFYAGDHKKAREYATKAKDLGSTATGLNKLLSQPVANDPAKPEVVDNH